MLQHFSVFLIFFLHFFSSHFFVWPLNLVKTSSFLWQLHVISFLFVWFHSLLLFWSILFTVMCVHIFFLLSSNLIYKLWLLCCVVLLLFLTSKVVLLYSCLANFIDIANEWNLVVTRKYQKSNIKIDVRGEPFLCCRRVNEIEWNFSKKEGKKNTF